MEKKPSAEARTVSMFPELEPGKKFDAGKLQYSLIPLDALREIVKVLMLGAGKYGPWNWMGVPEARTRYYDALQRHITAWFEGEKLDTEAGLHHLAHAACCILFLLALDLRGKFDNVNGR